MTATAEQLLDIEQPRRKEGIRFELLDASNSLLGTLATSRDAAPSMRNDATASIPRTVDRLLVPPRTTLTASSPLFFAQDLDTVTQRVRVMHVLGGGGVGYENAWGLFLFADDLDHRASGGTTKVCQLADQTQITSQLLSESVSYPVGTLISTALATQAGAAGIVATNIEASTATLSAPIVGLAGRDSHDTVLRNLCIAAGFLRPYFDNDGVLICRSAPELTSPPADTLIRPATTARAGSIDEASGLLRAPNRYIVRDTSVNDSELTGTFDVPDDAPHSFVNIGYHRIRSEDVQGLADQPSADAAAAALYAQEGSVFTSLSYESPLDSRHDTFCVVEFDALVYLEQEWTAQLRKAGRMGHDLRRLYGT